MALMRLYIGVIIPTIAKGNTRMANSIPVAIKIFVFLLPSFLLSEKIPVTIWNIPNNMQTSRKRIVSKVEVEFADKLF